jgi:membrane-bound lytic murein transglycosylase F
MTRDLPANPLWLLPLLLVALLGGCSEPQNEAAPAVVEKAEPAPLRILRPRHVQGLGYLPRSGLPQTEELALIEAFAAANNMQPEYVYVDGYDELIPRLLAGDGDIIVDNLTVTASRKKRINFTSPITFTKEQVIARSGDAPADAHALKGRTIAVHASDAYYETLQKLLGQRFQPPFEIQLVDESISTETILNGVAEGSYDLAVADSNLVDIVQGYRDNLEVAFDLGSVRPIAWGVRPDAPALLDSLNDFLGKHQLASRQALLASGDLGAIKKRGVLRVLTRNNATTYFLWRGELLGFEYELAKRFADRHNLRLEMVVPPSRDLLLPWLEQGRGDLVAASLAINDTRREQGVAFSHPYNKVSEIVVTRAGDDSLQSLEDLAGRTLVVRRSSSYWQSLQQLKEAGLEITLREAPEALETEELIERVARGEYDLTVADSHILDIELTWRDDIRAAFPLDAPQEHGWAVRKDNPKLLQAVNTFIRKEYRGLFYNVTYKKYFKNPKRIMRHVNQRTDGESNGALSPFDALAQKYSKEYGFDWRLVVSQMYQESRFDPQAKSWVGALGLMQVMPRTARELGLGNLRDPETGLHAGVKYLNWLMRRFEPELAVADRTWFALAAYNAGIGHVRDARRLAAQLGLSRDQWFGNVEKAMLLLAKSEYAKQAKHGYVRGHEPVNYVREIRDRYQAYLLLAGNTRPLLPEEAALN